MRMEVETMERIPRVTRSPRLAAMGVATLSGFTRYFLETARESNAQDVPDD